MKSLLSLVLFAVAACRLSAAEAHLEPEDAYFSSYAFLHKYAVQIRDTLLKGADDAPLARMVTLPSFVPESAVSVEEKSEKVDPEKQLNLEKPFDQANPAVYVVVQRVASASIWENKTPWKIRVAVREVPIDKETALLVQDVFFLATSQSRYPEKGVGGVDGATFHFASFRTGFGLRAGTVWSPDEKTLPGALVAYGELLRDYVQAPPDKRDAIKRRLQADGRVLLKRLGKKS